MKWLGGLSEIFLDVLLQGLSKSGCCCQFSLSASFLIPRHSKHKHLNKDSCTCNTPAAYNEAVETVCTDVACMSQLPA